MVSTGFKIVIQNHKDASSVTYIIDIHHLVFRCVCTNLNLSDSKIRPILRNLHLFFITNHGQNINMNNTSIPPPPSILHINLGRRHTIHDVKTKVL